MLEKCNIFRLMGWCAPGALPPHAIHFDKGPIELMLSSDRHITLRLTVFQDIRPKFRPKIWDFADPLAYHPQRGEENAWTDMCHHAKFHTDRCHRRRDSETENATTENAAPSKMQGWKTRD